MNIYIYIKVLYGHIYISYIVKYLSKGLKWTAFKIITI